MLIVLVATVGGSLRDEFEIPGSDTQKATDLIESQFASEQGGVLNIVFAAPQGERLDTPRAQGGDRAGGRELKSAEFKPTEATGAASRASATRSRRHVRRERAHRLRGGAVRPRRSTSKDRDAVVAVEDAVRKAVESAGVTVEYNGEAEFPPIEQGTQELLGLLAALIVLLVVFRTFVAT